MLAGAPFVLHRGSDKAQRHVWVAESGAEGGAMLRWQSHKGISWQRLRASRANVSKVQYHEAAVHLIQSVTYGTTLLVDTSLVLHPALVLYYDLQTRKQGQGRILPPATYRLYSSLSDTSLISVADLCH